MKSNISAQDGPEGSLYILQSSETGYGDSKSALIRIDYIGTRDEACLLVSIARSPAPMAAKAPGLAGLPVGGTARRCGGPRAIRSFGPQGLDVSL